MKSISFDLTKPWNAKETLVFEHRGQYWICASDLAAMVGMHKNCFTGTGKYSEWFQTIKGPARYSRFISLDRLPALLAILWKDTQNAERIEEAMEQFDAFKEDRQRPQRKRKATRTASNEEEDDDEDEEEQPKKAAAKATKKRALDILEQNNRVLLDEVKQNRRLIEIALGDRALQVIMCTPDFQRRVDEGVAEKIQKRLQSKEEELAKAEAQMTAQVRKRLEEQLRPEVLRKLKEELTQRAQYTLADEVVARKAPAFVPFSSPERYVPPESEEEHDDDAVGASIAEQLLAFQKRLNSRGALG